MWCCRHVLFTSVGHGDAARDVERQNIWVLRADLFSDQQDFAEV